MFPYEDKRCLIFQKNHNFDSYILINSYKIDVITDVCKIISKKLQMIFDTNKEKEDELIFFIEDLDVLKYHNDIQNLFCGQKIYINSNNAESLMKVSNYFEIPSLSYFLSDLIFDKNIIDQYFVNNQVVSLFSNLEKAIFSLSSDSSFNQSIEAYIDFIDKIGKHQFFKCFFKICQNSLLITLQQITKFISALQAKNPKIINGIIKYCKTELRTIRENKIILFILHELYEEKFITIENLVYIFNRWYPFLLIDIFGVEKYKLDSYWISEEEKNDLYAEHYENHKKGVLESHSRDPLLTAIRQDDINTLQNFVYSNESIDFKQKVNICEYERIQFINDGNCNLIEYSAFFGSINCFNYFMMNQPDYDFQKCLKFAIAGGHKNIIVAQYNSLVSLKNSLNVAAQFHRNTLLKWIMSNHFDDYNEDLMPISIENCNFKSLLSITQDGFSLFDFFFSAVVGNNLLLVMNSLEMLSLFQKENYINIRKNYIFL